ncbi:glycoside hydrolase family 55 protein [Microdochium trichocladiopsis]|uniref:Glycoside hydrolase family 55 protein n=1 Tax=Microdochium trichocladiopsis TaxID=1682393 RepID=A0A9P9BX21_9PEZI|nr:glycoside hydrolase family 55 protein [Microdochium trichocladiopsis]KAH7035656.1 glycoside hydrolase family 55 protein [Microdochium trichocladiopsis]
MARVLLLAASLLAATFTTASPVQGASSSVSHDEKRQSTSFWYANMDHTGNPRGYAPDLDGDFSYAVYKAVAPGDGAGIQRAINEGTNGATRHGQWLASQPRVVYIPPGTYTISNTIYMNTDTILMGDATNPPIIKAAPGFSGSQVLINGQDPSTGISGELSFAVGLKNLILDTTSIPGGNAFTALYWGVAQVAQLQNIKITMASSSGGNGHTGIRLGRGSTLALADVRVERGQNGIWQDGHQQALYKSIYFYQNTVGMLITGGATVSILAPTFETVGTAVLCTGGSPYIGLVDARSINSGVTFKTTVWPSFLIENLTKDTNSDIAQNPDGTLLSGRSHVDTYTFGNTVGRNPVYGATTTTNTRPQALAPGGRYPVLPAPNYASNTVADFINVKDPAQNGGRTVLGDNTKDESQVLNQILQLAASTGKIAYFPFGKYRVDDTLLIPKGSRIVGEAWATITGNGDRFKDESNPRPVVKVGNAGDVGVAQISDMRFTVSDVLPGAIVVQFNMAGSKPGDVALWNSLITIGGTRGASGLTDKCRDSRNECKAAFLGMHFTSGSSAYVENVWNWVADHITEDFNGGSSIAAKGGALVESTKGTWLHGLGSEHFWLYQLNLRKASNVMVSLLQSETNYDQGDNVQQIPPAPWVASVSGWGDPDFSWCSGGDTRCRMGFANYINGGSNIYTYASASWAFFSGPGYQSCAGPFACQNHLHWIEQTPSNFQAFGLCGKDSWAALRLGDGTVITSQPDFKGSWADGNGGSLVDRYTP